MLKNRASKPITLNDIINQFMFSRINTLTEKKLIKAKRYKRLERIAAELEEKISGFLTDEQKEIFREYNDLLVEITCFREEFIFKRGMIDAFRLKEIFIGTFGNM